MERGLSHSLPAIFVSAVLTVHLSAADPAAPRVPHSPVLQRFLALDDPTPTQCRALRHLEAANDKFGMHAWMDVWTEIDGSGFRYRIVAEEGSDWIRG